MIRIQIKKIMIRKEQGGGVQAGGKELVVCGV